MNGYGQSDAIELFDGAIIGLSRLVVEDKTPLTQMDAADEGYTNALAVRARVAVAQNGERIYQVRVSERADFEGAAWTTAFAMGAGYAELSINFSLADGGDGERTVYVQARSAQEQVSNVVSGSVVLDREAPGPAAVRFAEGAFTTTSDVHVVPDCPGADYMRLISSGSDVSGWEAGELNAWVPYSEGPIAVALSGVEGSKKVKLRFKDRAGNLSDEASATITWSDDGASEPRNLDSDHADDGEWTSWTDVHTFTWDAPTTIGASGIARYRYTTDGTVPDENSPSTADAGSRTFTFDPPDNGGQFIIRVRAEMNNGILGNYAEFRLLVDVNGLVLRVIAPRDGAFINQPQPVLVCEIENFSESGINEASIALVVAGQSYGVTSPAMVWEPETGRLTFDISLLIPRVELDGVVACTLDAATLAGQAATQLAWSFTVDLDAPTFTVEYFRDAALTEPIGLAVSVGPVYLKITADKALKSCAFDVDQPGATDVSGVAAVKVTDTVWRGTYMIRAEALPQYKDGTAYVAVSAESVAGNVAAHAAPDMGETFEIDTTPPTVALGYSAQHPLHLREGWLWIYAHFSESVEDVKVSVVSNLTGLPVRQSTAMESVSGSKWRYLWYVPALAEGDYTVVIDAVDLAGNPNAPATNSALVFDKTPATIYGIHVTPAVASTVVGHDLVQIEFRSNEPLDPETVGVTVAGSAATLAGATANGQRWFFEYAVTGEEPEGAADVAISADDLAGNSSTATASVVFDFTPPLVAITKPSAPGEALTDDLLELEWSWSDANGIDLGAASIRLNGVDITERCVLTPLGGTFRAG